MTCKICGKNSCTESFHSIEDQMDFEENKDVELLKQRIEGLEREVKIIRDQAPSINEHGYDMEKDELIAIIHSMKVRAKKALEK